MPLNDLMLKHGVSLCIWLFLSLKYFVEYSLLEYLLFWSKIVFPGIKQLGKIDCTNYLIPIFLCFIETLYTKYRLFTILNR